MIITVELPDTIANGSKPLTEKDLSLLAAGLQQFATHEAERLANMTDAERREFEEVRAAIAESEAQYERGEYMTWEEARARSEREMEAERLREKVR